FSLSLPAFSTLFLSPFFFIDPAPPEIYTLSLHDALPISLASATWRATARRMAPFRAWKRVSASGQAARASASSAGSSTCSGSGSDRKSTRLNSSHDQISYAVFCLKKKKKKKKQKVL